MLWRVFGIVLDGRFSEEGFSDEVPGNENPTFEGLSFGPRFFRNSSTALVEVTRVLSSTDLCDLCIYNPPYSPHPLSNVEGPGLDTKNAPHRGLNN